MGSLVSPAKVYLILFLFIIPGLAQDELPPDFVEPPPDYTPDDDLDHPITFPPEQIEKAHHGICDFLGEELAVITGHRTFLDDNWTLNLTNTTGLFTA